MSDSPPAATPQPVTVTLADAIHAGQHLQRSGKLAEAEAVYLEILALVPDEPNALHFLGVLRHQQNRNDEALDLIRRAGERLPGDGGPWVNLGNVLLEMQRFDDAIDAYKQAADYAPDNVLIYNNLGLLHTRRNSLDLAEQCYQRALALSPQSEFVLLNFARLRQRQGHYQEAIAYSMKSLATNPNEPKARRLLAMSHALLGDAASARDVLREWIAQEPDNPQPRHLLAGVGGIEAPARASDAYIVSEFDSFSKSFDAKLEALGYRAPELVAAALARAMAPAARFGDILDAGCGTGLCAPHLRPLAARLEGVDLSPGMLAKALQRGGYDDLKQAELTEYLAYYPARWNAVVSADTLCYFGDLAPVLAAARTALRAQGWLVFSVEAKEPEASASGFSIQYHGRYVHSRAYLEQSLRAAGFTAVGIEAAVLRTEAARPVDGWVVVAQKAAA
jgi:predicted TPR repeat methyltransferase